MNTIVQVENAIAEVEAKIANVNQQIEDKQREIDRFEYSCSEAEYDEFLDEIEGSVTIAGMEFYASAVLKSCDPVAYHCAKSDYESNYDVEDCAEWQDLDRELLDLRSKLEDLEGELEALQDELNNED